MKATLLLIDPQHDFCDLPGAALPVTGADADLRRVASLMQKAGAGLADVIVTLDSHAHVGIERTTFWTTGEGGDVAPFTQITAADVGARTFLPRDAARLPAVLDYLAALERGGRYRLVVWPVHCVVGTPGHTLHADVADQIAAWERRTQRPALRVLKGLNPMTEQYSAVQAEVPDPNDPTTQTNHALIARATTDGLLWVAGEAASHCVAATMEHLFAAMPAPVRARVRILGDCMSAVRGFEAQAATFHETARAAGARVVTAAEALAEIA
jgi:nicotinamidase/pyrazinamidase